MEDFEIENGVLVKYKGKESHIEIPKNVTEIDSWAFAGCNSLNSIEIPSSVKYIDKGAFSNCSSLTSIVVDSSNSVYDSRNNCNAIIETASNTLIVGCKNTVIPNSVLSIGVCAFFNCTSLMSIEIPNSVACIGSYAFSHCYNLTSIKIPNSLTKIGNDAFRGCTRLINIEIPNSVTCIDSNAFEFGKKVNPQPNADGSLRAFKAFNKNWT
jgi:hypothetical protein